VRRRPRPPMSDEDDDELVRAGRRRPPGRAAAPSKTAARRGSGRRRRREDGHAAAPSTTDVGRRRQREQRQGRRDVERQRGPKVSPTAWPRAPRRQSPALPGGAATSSPTASGSERWWWRRPICSRRHPSTHELRRSFFVVEWALRQAFLAERLVPLVRSEEPTVAMGPTFFSLHVDIAPPPHRSTVKGLIESSHSGPAKKRKQKERRAREASS
jgi:hypothetical protein